MILLFINGRYAYNFQFVNLKKNEKTCPIVMEQNRIFELFSLVKIAFILKAKPYFIYFLYLKVLSVCYKIDLK